MNIGVISVRYARALLKAAVEAGAEDEVYREMLALAQSFIVVSEFKSAVDNPMLPKDSKRDLIVTACGGDISELVRTFITLVLKKDREGVLQFIANSYITLYRQHKNIIRGKLTTAVPVSDATKQKMRLMVESKAKGTVEFETEVNPDIIGGFILEYDTYRLDVSVQSQLRDVLSQLSRQTVL